MVDQVQGVPAPPPHPFQLQHKQDNRPNNNSSSKIILPLQHMPPLFNNQDSKWYTLNWSYFKAEFSGKSDEDAEAHLLCTNNWMNTHHLLKVSKSKDFA